MNYDLAKQLKDAGYPQPPLVGFNNGNRQVSWYECYIPTLSELIEACGNSFYSLHKNSFEEYLWLAENDADAVYGGKTPEEAVANLWLELNKCPHL